ncbi:MAG: putative amidohydrolase [Frankiales bacterium]|jgi:predicted amidohydrolase|nr:putative amidohydrolase [Frankiales bacterium]
MSDTPRPQETATGRGDYPPSRVPREEDLVTIASCSYPAPHDVRASVEQHLRFIDEAADRNARLVLFPEISLQGYPAKARSLLAEHIGVAERVPDGPNVRAVIDHAEKRKIFVCFGVSEATDQPGVLHNTAVLCGPNRYIGRYRKCHMAPEEQLFWRPGRDWPVFDTELGTIGIQICGDIMWPEAGRELALRGADLILTPKCWPGGPMWDAHQLLWETARATENGRWLVSSNYADRHDGLAYPGDARIIEPLGRVVATTGTDPGLAVARVDLTGGLLDWVTAYSGARLIRDRQPSTYRVLRGELEPAVD